MAGWSPGRTPTPVEGDFGPVTMTLDRGIRGVLRAYIRGEGGHADAALRRWRYNVTLARDLGLHNILVVLELTGAEIPKPAMAAMISQVADLGLDGVRVGIVQTRHERQANDESGVLVAMECGITARIFSDELSALIWLHHGER
jgi:hypothetical protein